MSGKKAPENSQSAKKREESQKDLLTQRKMVQQAKKMNKLSGVDRNMCIAACIMSLAYCETTTALSIYTHNRQFIPRVIPQCFGFFKPVKNYITYPFAIFSFTI